MHEGFDREARPSRRTMMTSFAAALSLTVLMSAHTVRAQMTAPVASSAPGAVTPAPVAPPKVLLFGKLVDGSGKLISNAAVYVENGHIKSIGDKSQAPASVAVIDLSRFTAIPGLIDAHTHLAGNPGAPTKTPNQTLRRNPAIDMFLAQHAAMTMLESGVTSVRNLGAVQFMDIAMRDLIFMGAITGPRMIVSGPGLRTSEAMGLPIPEVTIDNPGDARRAVRYLVANGVDYIKIFGSTGNGLDLTGFPTWTYPELEAAISTAHALGRKVAVHSYGPDGARDAVKAGADSIEHAVDLDDATLAEMKRRGTYYVPTIDHNRYYYDHTARNEQDKAALTDFINRNLETAKHAHKVGVKFAMGSDGGATANGAELLGHQNDLGKLAPGYIADIVAVDGNPLADVNVVINNVRWVMKDGAVVVDKTKATAAQ